MIFLQAQLPIETANWVIAVLLAMLSVMLWRFFVRLDKKLDGHDELLIKHESRHDGHDKEFLRMKEGSETKNGLIDLLEKVLSKSK